MGEHPTPDTTTVGDAGPPTVHRAVDLDAPPEEVWDAVTRPERLADWLEAGEVAFVAEPGAPARFVGVDGEERVAVVEDVVPERRLAFRWWPEGHGDAASRVELDLVPTPGGTRLTVVEAPLAPSTTVTASALAGRAASAVWAWRLDLLLLGLRVPARA